jgi:hypothetical protein
LRVCRGLGAAGGVAGGNWGWEGVHACACARRRCSGGLPTALGQRRRRQRAPPARDGWSRCTPAGTRYHVQRRVNKPTHRQQTVDGAEKAGLGVGGRRGSGARALSALPGRLRAHPHSQTGSMAYPGPAGGRGAAAQRGGHDLAADSVVRRVQVAVRAGCGFEKTWDRKVLARLLEQRVWEVSARSRPSPQLPAAQLLRHTRARRGGAACLVAAGKSKGARHR